MLLRLNILLCVSVKISGSPFQKLQYVSYKIHSQAFYILLQWWHDRIICFAFCISIIRTLFLLALFFFHHSLPRLLVPAFYIPFILVQGSLFSGPIITSYLFLCCLESSDFTKSDPNFVYLPKIQPHVCLLSHDITWKVPNGLNSAIVLFLPSTWILPTSLLSGCSQNSSYIPILWISFLVLPHVYSLSNPVFTWFPFKALLNAFSPLPYLSHPSHIPLPHSLPQASFYDAIVPHRAVLLARPTTHPQWSGTSVSWPHFVLQPYSMSSNACHVMATQDGATFLQSVPAHLHALSPPEQCYGTLYPHLCVTLEQTSKP